MIVSGYVRVILDSKSMLNGFTGLVGSNLAYSASNLTEKNILDVVFSVFLP